MKTNSTVKSIIIAIVSMLYLSVFASGVILIANNYIVMGIVTFLGISVASIFTYIAIIGATKKIDHDGKNAQVVFISKEKITLVLADKDICNFANQQQHTLFMRPEDVVINGNSIEIRKKISLS